MAKADKLPRRYLISFCHQAVGICTNQTKLKDALDCIAETFGEELYCEKPPRGVGFSNPDKKISERIEVRPITASLINRMLDQNGKCVIFMTSDLEESSSFFNPEDGQEPSLGVTQFNPNIITYIDDDEVEHVLPV